MSNILRNIMIFGVSILCVAGSGCGVPMNAGNINSMSSTPQNAPAGEMIVSSNNIPGDANGDGIVDVGDLGILAANYGKTSGATWGMGDFNSDGTVDVGDLGILAANYGQSMTMINADQDYMNFFRPLNLNDVSGKIVSVKELLGVVNVKGLGAAGDGIADDTAAIQSAVNVAKTLRGVVYLPAGTYKVSSTITVTNGEFYGCRLEGVNAEGTKILSTITNSDPLFKFQGGSGGGSNVGLSNMTLTASTAGQGTAVYLNGQCFAIYKNLRIINFKNGLWLHNQNPGSFTEANQFSNIGFEFCNNGIRMEQGGGNDSFHGNGFNNCFFKIGANQIGFNHVAGYYYNGRFKLIMQAYDRTSVYLNADGTAEHNIGDITYESFQTGKFTGSGRFWFNGFIQGVGGVNDQAIVAAAPHQRSIACTNYWKSVAYGTTGMTAAPIPSANGAYNGSAGQVLSGTKENVSSIIINTYSGSDENGLYLGQTGWQQDESGGIIGTFLAGSGSTLKTYNPSGLSIITSDNNVALHLAEGKITIGDGISISKFLGATAAWTPTGISAGSAVTTTLNVPGASQGDPVYATYDKIAAGKIHVYAAVTSVNTVTVTLYNQTGSYINLPAGNVKVGVWKF